MPQIRKQLIDVTHEDLMVLVAAGWLEDEQMDFKTTIPHKDGEGADRWRDKREIKEYGRDQLLATVVAFANSYGGDLLIGISEISGSQPGRAKAIQPLPDCEDAAHRLSQAANEVIEPPLTSLQVRGIACDVDGGGVIVIRVQRSRNAPHRLASNKECYQRVRHETKPMSMRQIQELTFSVARGLDRITGRLDELGKSFRGWYESNLSADIKRFGISVRCVPADPAVYMPRVHGVQEIRPDQRHPKLKLKGNTDIYYDLHFPIRAYNWRPSLRGTEAGQDDSEAKERMGVYSDGSVRFEFCSDIKVIDDDALAMSSRRTHALYPGWFFATVVNAVETCEKIKKKTGMEASEYVMEMSISITHPLPVLRFGNSYYGIAGTLAAGTNNFPNYVLGSTDSKQELYLLIWRDFWNLIGSDAHEDEIELV